MATTPIGPLSPTSYMLVTSKEAFTAQNRDSSKQEWVRTPSPPADDLMGVLVKSEKGMLGSQGTDPLYAKGEGFVVVIT